MNENVIPQLSVLTEEQIQKIHDYSLDILSNTGIKVECKKAQKIFERSGSVKIQDDIVYISKELIDFALKVVPDRIKVYRKTGDLAFETGADQTDTFFGIGVTNINFQEIETNNTVPFTRKHMQTGTKLGDILESYDMISTLGIPHDINAENSDLYNALDMYVNTDKPIVKLISEGNNITEVYKLFEQLHGDIGEKPFIVPYFNPISPLILNKSTSDKIIDTIHFNLPFIFSNYGMYGGTTPITEAGSLAVLNAELLAGLVFSQLVKESTPVILGSLPAGFNMQIMSSYYSTSSYMMNLANAEMMNYYNIPHCGTSGSSSGRGPDLLASGDLWINHLTSCIGKVGMAPFVGGNFDSTAFSPATVVLSDYIIAEARRFSKGFVLNDKTTNLDEIASIGHGGNYLTSEQTLASLYENVSYHNFWQSMNHDIWTEMGNPKTEKFLIDHSKELYDKAEKESSSLSDQIVKGEEEIKKIIAER
jgi:trimethylamine--corrinoid protein Co-methyltransferase